MSTRQPLITPSTTGTKSTLWVLLPGLAAMTAILVGLVFLLRQQRPSLPVISQVSSFTLTNQLGQAFSADDLRGKVWIANIIFTHCPGPCREMSKRMERLQAELVKESSLRFVSLTADPQVDVPEVLKRYAAIYHADPARWVFLTGSKADIVKLAVDDLKLTVVEKEERQRQSIDDLFIHSTISVLVDKHGRLRASVEILEPGGVERLRDLARHLITE